MKPPRTPGFLALAAMLATAALVAAPAARAAPQELERGFRSFDPPPPSETSTGGVPTEPIARLHGAPRLRGREFVTRDALHPEPVALIGLEQSQTPYRPDLPLKRTALGASARPDDAADPESTELYRRQLAIHSGEGAVELPDDLPKDPAPPAVDEPETPPPNAFPATGVVVATALAVGALLLLRRRVNVLLALRARQRRRRAETSPRR